MTAAAAARWPFPGLVWGPYPQHPLPPPRTLRSQRASRRRWVSASKAVAGGGGVDFDDPLFGALARACAALATTHGIAARWEQVLAARAMLDQRLVEMATGEGKTYAIALAAAVAAAAGTPVHVVTANDYLAERDALALQPFFSALGLACGFVAEATPRDARRQAYASNVTYCTARELVFDYLRDGLEQPLPGSSLQARIGGAGDAAGGRLLRGLCMALLDEADTLLIDGALTPFVLSRAAGGDGTHAFLRECWLLARSCVQGADFHVGSAREVRLLPGAHEKIAKWPRSANPLHSHPVQREESLRLALTALHVLRRDEDYVVQGGGVQLVDLATGRSSAGRAWSQGLHQFVELKEGTAPTQQTEAAAQVVCQRFFARYLRLAGVSGTLAEGRRELKRVYGLAVFPVPSHRPRAVFHGRTLFFPDRRSLWPAVAERVSAVAGQGRPVLVGTGSVAETEALSALLAQRGVAHQVLHARADREEAGIVAGAGTAGRITVATNMAGRGTDILLAPGVAERGGLHVLLCQANASRRIDRQFMGRCGRQGQPGSTEQWVALDFPLLMRWLPPTLRRGLTSIAPLRTAYLFLRWAQLRQSYAESRQRVTLCERAEAQERDLAFSPDPHS